MSNIIAKKMSKIIDNDKLSKKILENAIENSKKWMYEVEARDLLIKNEEEYKLLELYRSIKNNKKYDNDKLIKKIEIGDTEYLKHTRSMSKLFT